MEIQPERSRGAVALADYQTAYDAALCRCSTDSAPWYVVPSNKKWYRNWAVTRLLIETLDDMDPRYPERELDIPHLARQLSVPDAFADTLAASEAPTTKTPPRRRRPLDTHRRLAANTRRQRKPV